MKFEKRVSPVRKPTGGTKTKVAGAAPGTVFVGGGMGPRGVGVAGAGGRIAPAGGMGSRGGRVRGGTTRGVAGQKRLKKGATTAQRIAYATQPITV